MTDQPMFEVVAEGQVSVAPPAPSVDFKQIMAFEQGDLSAEDTVTMFAGLIATGLAWKLQGSYGRAARDLIERGLISAEGVVDQDAVDAVLAD